MPAKSHKPKHNQMPKQTAVHNPSLIFGIIKMGFMMKTLQVLLDRNEYLNLRTVCMCFWGCYVELPVSTVWAPVVDSFPCSDADVVSFVQNGHPYNKKLEDMIDAIKERLITMTTIISFNNKEVIVKIEQTLTNSALAVIGQIFNQFRRFDLTSCKPVDSALVMYLVCNACNTTEIFAQYKNQKVCWDYSERCLGLWSSDSQFQQFKLGIVNNWVTVRQGSNNTLIYVDSDDEKYNEAVNAGRIAQKIKDNRKRFGLTD